MPSNNEQKIKYIIYRYSQWDLLFLGNKINSMRIHTIANINFRTSFHVKEAKQGRPYFA